MAERLSQLTVSEAFAIAADEVQECARNGIDPSKIGSGLVPCDHEAVARAGIAIGELLRERGDQATMLELGTAALRGAGQVAAGQVDIRDVTWTPADPTNWERNR